MADWNDRERDIKQRSVGLIGFSMMAHAGLLALLAIIPVSSNEPYGTSMGDGGTQTAFMEFQEGAVGAPAPESLGDSAPLEESADSMIAVDTTTSAPNAPNEDSAPKAQVETIKDAELEAPVLVEKTAPIKKPVVESKPIVINRPVVKSAPKIKPKAESLAPLKSQNQNKPLIATDEQGDVLNDAMTDTAKDDLTESVEEVPSPKLAKTSTVSKAAIPEEAEEPTEASATESPITEDAQVTEPAAQTAVAKKANEPVAEPVTEKSMPEKPMPEMSVAPKAVEVVKPRAIVSAKEFPESTSSGSTSSAALSSDELAAERQMVAANSNGQTENPAGGQSGNQGGGSGAAVNGTRPGQFGVPAGTQIRDAQELAAQPNNANPSYPTPDRLAGREGIVVLVGKVKMDGTMADVFIERSSGSKSMDQEALQKFKSWKFKPNQEGYIRKPFQFTLSGEAKTIPARLRR